MLAWDPFALAGQDPYRTYRDLRNQAPAYRNPTRGFWALSRFEDVRGASRDWQTFSNAAGVDLDELGQRIFGPGDFLDTDPPEHDELRSVVRDRFTPKGVGTLEPTIQGQLEPLLAKVADGGEIDAVEELAWPLPVHVMCSVLGISPADRAEVGGLYRRVMERSPDGATIPEPAVAAAAEMRAHFLDAARERRASPADDLITEIANGVVDGRPLPDSKIVGMCFVLFSAGIDTVASLLASSILLLAEHPEQRRLILDEPGRLPVAVEEALRYESPLQFNARTTTQDVTIHGEVIARGERVLLLYGSANRDERRFESPERFDVMREPKRHLGFGEGIHFCIGAALARLQTRLALQALLSLMPDFEIAGPVRRLPAYNMRSLASLPISG